MKKLPQMLRIAVDDYIDTGKPCHIDVLGYPIYMTSKQANALADEIEREQNEIIEKNLNSPYECLCEWGNFWNRPFKRDEGVHSWLNRWFFAKPVGDDGQPIDFDKTVFDKVRGEITVNRICYTKSGWYFNSSHTNNPRRRDDRIVYGYGSQVELPKPALDADGVEINVGDTVYLVPGKHCNVFPLLHYMAGVEYTVEENKSPSHKANGRICISRGDSIKGFPMPEQVTHRKPDSLDKLLIDLRRAADFIPSKEYLKHLADRLTAIMERDA